MNLLGQKHIILLQTSLLCNCLLSSGNFIIRFKISAEFYENGSFKLA